MVMYIDDREERSGLIDLLKRQHLDIEVKHLESADICFGEVGIERKTTYDLVNSVIGQNRRLWTQLETLRNTYKTPILLIEGTINWKDRLLSGIICTIILFWKYQTIFTHNTQETALVLNNLFIKYGIGKSNREPPAPVIRAETPEKVTWAILQCFKGIGPKTATEILNIEPNIFRGRYSSKELRNKLSKVKRLKKEPLELLIKVISNNMNE